MGWMEIRVDEDEVGPSCRDGWERQTASPDKEQKGCGRWAKGCRQDWNPRQSVSRFCAGTFLASLQDAV